MFIIHENKPDENTLLCHFILFQPNFFLTGHSRCLYT